jgi:hypothetical protein
MAAWGVSKCGAPTEEQTGTTGTVPAVPEDTDNEHGTLVVVVVCGSKFVGLGDENVKTSRVGSTLRVRWPPVVTVREIGAPTLAVGESCDAQAGSDVAVIVPVAA